MLKKDLVKAVARETGKPEALVREVFEAVGVVVRRAVAAGQSVMLMGLGKLVISRRGPRAARNIRTGETVSVPAHNAVLLRASEALTEAANA